MGTDNTDDQELAKALAGMSSELSEKTAEASTGMAFEETPTQSGAVANPDFGTPLAAASPVSEPIVAPTPVALAPEPVIIPAPAPVDNTSSLPIPSDDTSNLDDIKKDALKELRPLVDKLTVPPEEKFDTYLLLLRSTDDMALIAPAHAAAKEIPDEARRAQALLDVIKEIDYLSSRGKKL